LKKKKVTVGRSELVSFPALGINAIEAKIDTGAYSTAIHAHKIWVEEKDGESTLHFDLLDPNNPNYVEEIISTTDFYQKRVRSSNGRMEKRYMIKTSIVIGGKKSTTDLSLTNRGKMRFPVLIGRKVLKKGFLVDVSEKNIH
jgi:hypothetical protein